MALSFIKDFNEKISKEQEAIKSLQLSAKSLSELVLEESFIVNHIEVSFDSKDISPVLAMNIPGDNSSYSSGYISQSILNVSPENESVPVKKLVFCGNSAVRGGDLILARIPFSKFIKPSSFIYSNFRPFYAPRELNPEEEAIAIKILSRDGTVLRTELSARYQFYQPR